MLSRGEAACDVSVWAHEERGLSEVGLRDDANRKAPKACDVRSNLLPFGLGDDEPEGGVQVPIGAVAGWPRPWRMDRLPL